MSNREKTVNLEQRRSNAKMQSIALNAWFGSKQALKDINLIVKENAVTAIIGPSGCGKSTFIRCLNRMHELVPTARMAGQVLLDGNNIYSSNIAKILGKAFYRYDRLCIHE